MAYDGLSGLGLVYPSADTPLGQYVGLNESLSSIVINKAVDETDVIGWKAGSAACQQSVLRTLSATADWTLTVTYQELTWELLQHLTQEFAAASAAYLAKKSFDFQVPDTAPYEVASPFIGAGAAVATSSVGWTERGAYGERGPITVQAGAPADATAVQLDIAGSKLVFDAADDI